MLRRGQQLVVEAEGLNAAGDAVLRHAGVELRVRALLPGERATVVIDHVSRGAPVAFASVVERITSSPGRRQPPCAHAGVCDGCPLMAVNPAQQLALKTKAIEQELGRQIDEFVTDPDCELGYRWSSKRVVGGAVGAIILGSFRRGSHEVADMSDCLVDHPALSAAARQITLACNALGVVPFDERSGRGDLRYVWLKTNHLGQVLVTLISGSSDSAANQIAKRLDGVFGVFWAVQPSSGNAIRAADAACLQGEPHIEVELGGQSRRQGPLAFLQPNPKLAELCYQEMVRGLSGDRAFDLYAGAGITAALLGGKFREVVAVEAFPEAAKALGTSAQTVAEFLATADGSQPPGAVLANPPRAGMGAAVCRRLVELGAKHLHVMSCNPASMARDLETLGSAYQIETVRAYDTLPQTMHVELVVRMTR